MHLMDCLRKEENFIMHHYRQDCVLVYLRPKIMIQERLALH